MSNRKSFTARIAIATLAGFILLAGSNLALAKKGQSKWPVAMGEITKIDSAKQIVEIKNADGEAMRFRITPQTEMYKERERPIKFVWPADFSDFKEGQWVRIKYYGNADPKIAHDVDIFLGAPPQ